MLKYKTTKNISSNQLASLYKSVRWLHYLHPAKLKKAVQNSDSVISAWDGRKLVGIGRAVSDGAFNVYFPDIAVAPEYRGQGIGSTIIKHLIKKYDKIFNLTAIAEDLSAQKFYWRHGMHDRKIAFRIIRPLDTTKI